MSKVVKSLDTGLGGQIEQKGSKIKAYGLEDDVLKFYAEGYTNSRIAKECNKILEARKTEEVYTEINHQNVAIFLTGVRREIQSSNPSELANTVSKFPDIGEKLTNMLNTLEDELSKLRSTEGPVLDSKQMFFIQLVDKITEQIHLAANIKGLVQPNVSVAIFNNISANVNKLTDKIKNSKTLTEDAKNEVLDLISDELITETLLKTVQGQIIDAKDVK